MAEAASVARDRHLVFCVQRRRHLHSALSRAVGIMSSSYQPPYICALDICLPRAVWDSRVSYARLLGDAISFPSYQPC